MKIAHIKAVSDIKMVVHFGTKEFDPGPLNQLLETACQELYGPGWPERLRFEEGGDEAR